MVDEEVSRAAASVLATANRAAGVLEAYKATAERNASIARAQAAKVREQAISAARDTLRVEIQAARSACEELATGLAPGPLGARWDEAAVLGHHPGVLDAAEYVRCGSLHTRNHGAPQTEAPLLLPLLDHGSIRILARAERREAVAGVLQEITLRTLLGTGAGQVSLLTFDPELSASLAMFAPLRQASEEVVGPALSSADELRAVLEGLSRDVRRITDMYGGVPATLGEFRRSTGQPIEHYQLVAVLDYPTGFDERLNTLLVTLLRTAPRCGISFVIHHNPAARIPDGVDPSVLEGLTTTLDLDAATCEIAPQYQVRAGTAPSQALVEPAIAGLATRIRQAAAPRIDFLDLQPGVGARWSDRSADRVTAVIGRIGHHPIAITLGDEVEQKHNVLVTGAVGQGKSNLLMALIHSWAMRYSPGELELFLLDFKDGVTLYPLAAHGASRDWLPHARVLGLESDRPFGLAVLEHLVGEFETRSRIIKPYGDNIARYRKEQPDAKMPRIIVVIDEFQVLFEQDDDTTSAALLALDRLARRGRAYGIHLVLASQTLSGITALLAKQDGIFSQFPIRLALYNSASESRAVLSQNNTEAARLRYRGELVVNRDFGEADANQRGVVAYADPEQLRAVRASLVERDRTGRHPTVFNGSLPASLVDHLRHRERPSLPTALLGMTIGVEAQPFEVTFDDSNGRHLSILGTGKRVDGTAGNPAADALQAAVQSLAWSIRPGSATFIVLNLLGTADPSQEVIDTLVTDLRVAGHAVTLASGPEVLAALAAIDQEVAARRVSPTADKVYVVGFGMDRLAQARTINFSTGASPVDGLHAVWRDGAPLGVHLLGWWSNVRIYNDHVGLEAQGLIDASMVFKVSTDAAADIFGPFISWGSPDNRALIRDVAFDTEPITVVPFGPASLSGVDPIDASDRTTP